MECGDGYQIELDKTHSDPFKCSALVIADKSCGEYFEVRRDKNMCRCTKAEKNKDCKKRSDKNTVLYRIDRSKNQKLKLHGFASKYELHYFILFMCTFSATNINHSVSVDPTCEKCPKGVCDRSTDGKCKIYSDGYHCLLGAVGVQCDYGSNCFDYGGYQFYTWIGSSANVDIDKCYPGNYFNC